MSDLSSHILKNDKLSAFYRIQNQKNNRKKNKSESREVKIENNEDLKSLELDKRSSSKRQLANSIKSFNSSRSKKSARSVGKG
jgi:hypothetical protein